MLGEGRSFSNEVIERAGHLLGVVSWHYYPQQSHRCPVATRRARPGVLPPPAQLDDVEHWAQGVAAAARAHAPGAQLWLGETGSAQCGGEPGLSNAFADSLWWVDQLGRLARRGHAVVVRQTLSGSDYGLIDDASLEPNPSYWASWLWRRLMGTEVLAAGTDTVTASLRVYAHCTPARAPGYTPGLGAPCWWSTSISRAGARWRSGAAASGRATGVFAAGGPPGRPPGARRRQPAGDRPRRGSSLIWRRWGSRWPPVAT